LFFNYLIDGCFTALRRKHFGTNFILLLVRQFENFDPTVDANENFVDVFLQIIHGPFLFKIRVTKIAIGVQYFLTIDAKLEVWPVDGNSCE
jgi:hypothetical protein